MFTNQILVAWIFWIDRNGHVSKHSLRTSGCHFKGAWAIFQHVVHVVEGTFDILVNHLDIRKGCASCWIPVDDKLTTVDPTFLVKVDKDLTNGFWQTFVKSETLTRVVYREPHLAPLFLDSSGIFVFPFPNFVEEFLTTQVVTGNALTQALLNLSLSRNPRVVHPWKPKRIKTLHAFLTDDDIL